MPTGLTEEAKAVPESVWKKALQSDSALIINDYWLARRQRVHFAWLPRTDEVFSEHELTEVVQWVLDHEYSTVILVPGVRRRPQPYFLLTLEALEAS